MKKLLKFTNLNKVVLFSLITIPAVVISTSAKNCWGVDKELDDAIKNQQHAKTNQQHAKTNQQHAQQNFNIINSNFLNSKILDLDLLKSIFNYKFYLQTEQSNLTTNLNKILSKSGDKSRTYFQLFINPASNIATTENSLLQLLKALAKDHKALLDKWINATDETEKINALKTLLTALMPATDTAKKTLLDKWINATDEKTKTTALKELLALFIPKSSDNNFNIMFVKNEFNVINAIKNQNWSSIYVLQVLNNIYSPSYIKPILSKFNQTIDFANLNFNNSSSWLESKNKLDDADAKLKTAQQTLDEADAKLKAAQNNN